MNPTTPARWRATLSPRAFICRGPGCNRLVDTKGGRCPECKRAHQQQDWARRVARGTRWIYDHVRWPIARRLCFERDGYRCRAVDDGARCTFTDRSGRRLHAHHAPRSALELLQHGLDPFDPRYLVTLCPSHHSQVEAQLRLTRRG